MILYGTRVTMCEGCAMFCLSLRQLVIATNGEIRSSLITSKMVCDVRVWSMSMFRILSNFIRSTANLSQ